MNIHRIAEEIQKAGHDYKGIGDAYGVYAVETDNYIVTAKKYIFKNIASVQKDILHRCCMEDKMLVIYFKDEGKFYKFDADDCLAYAYQNDSFNQRADLDETYADFPIHFGERTEINR